jgi:hypothetical protein
MASTASAILTDHGPAVPAMGTLPSSENTLYPKGTIVTCDGDGLAVSPSTADASGFKAHGIAKATFDNRTDSEMGGLDSSGVIEIDYGVFGFAYTGDPIPGATVWVVDNQTVSDDSNTGLRGVAGVCTEVRDGLCFVWMNPAIAELFSDDSALESALVTAQEDIDDLQASAVLWESPNLVPLLRLSTGADVPAFSDGVADGYQLTDSEAFALRINDDSTTTFVTTISLPDDLDDAADIVIKILGARIGAADVADVALTIGAFFHTVGAAHTADDDCGGESSAFTAATTVISEETLTILATNVPAAPCSLTLTFTVTSELDGDDLILTSIKATGLKTLGA